MDNIADVSTSELLEIKAKIDKELKSRNKHMLKSSIWKTKLDIIKELSYRIKK